MPIYHVTGWYDSWGTQVANINYIELKKAKKSLQRLIIGPWTHGGQTRAFAGDAEFTPDAALDFDAWRLRWLDRWMKGTQNGVDKEAPVRLYVMGEGEPHKTATGRLFVGGHWRDEQEWPLARTAATPYYLHAGGMLSTDKPAEAPPTKYLFDPQAPGADVGWERVVAGHAHVPGRLGPEVPHGLLALRGHEAALGPQRRARVPDPARSTATPRSRAAWS